MKESNSGYRSSLSASTDSFLPIEVFAFDGNMSQDALNNMSDLHCSVDSFPGKVTRWTSEHGIDCEEDIPSPDTEMLHHQTTHSRARPDASPRQPRRRSSASDASVTSLEKIDRRPRERPSPRPKNRKATRSNEADKKGEKVDMVHRATKAF